MEDSVRPSGSRQCRAREQLLPGAWIRFHAAHRGVHLLIVSAVTHPYDAEASLAPKVENSDYISGLEIGLEP